MKKVDGNCTRAVWIISKCQIQDWYKDTTKKVVFPYTALFAPGTWYLKCNLANQYLAWVFELSASRANSNCSFAVWKINPHKNVAQMSKIQHTKRESNKKNYNHITIIKQRDATSTLLVRIRGHYLIKSLNHSTIVMKVEIAQWRTSLILKQDCHNNPQKSQQKK